MSSEDVMRQARELIAQEKAQEEFQTTLKSTNDAGQKEFGDGWGKALDELALRGTVDPEDFSVILSTDAPEKVLHALGGRIRSHYVAGRSPSQE
jgi:hypothetical protein